MATEQKSTYERQVEAFDKQTAAYEASAAISMRRQRAWDEHELAMARIEAYYAESQASYYRAKREEHERYIAVMEALNATEAIADDPQA